MSPAPKMFTYAQVLKSSLKYFNGDELAASTWMNKYAHKDEQGKFFEQNPDAMHLRMAKQFYRIERKYRYEKNPKHLSSYGQFRKPLTVKRIYEYFKDFKYIVPQGSVMASLGLTKIIASYSNCVVLPEIVDSYAGILYTDQQLAQLFKRRCGVGIDISTLRPEGKPVSNAAKTTSGAVSFMDRYSATTREVAQNGRRGALMITMDIAHPDIEKFVTIKQDLNKITGANISIRLSDEFMTAVENDTTYTHRWPIDAKKPKFVKKVRARDLWNTIIRCAHNTAEPGLIFWDRQHNYSTSSIYPGYKNVSTNPCSEIAMQGGDSCRLIAINLFSLVDQPFTKNARFNYTKWYEVVYEAQRLMDDLVDLELEAIEKIIKKTQQDPEPSYIKAIELQTWKLLYETGKKGRRTGLGFTALGDALAALNHAFDSAKAAIELEKIMKVKCEAEFDSTIDLALERGKFHDFNPRIEAKSAFIQMLRNELPHVYQRMMKYGRRNISISTVAPTGSLSILTQTSSGIEPVFMLAYKRRKKISAADRTTKIDFTDSLGDNWQEFTVYHPKLKQWMQVTGNTNPLESPYAGATASEINALKRIQLQAIVQKYTTHSISSTINLPATATTEQVQQIYFQAWKMGLKGITVYRDGARSGVLIPIALDAKRPKLMSSEAPPRPGKLEAEVVRFRNYNENWLAIVGLLDNQPYEIFTGKEDNKFTIPEHIKKGWVVKSVEASETRYDFIYQQANGQFHLLKGLSQTFNPEFWNYAKLISGVLRQGMPLTQVVDLVTNLKFYDDTITTWKNGVVRALKRFVKDGEVPPDHHCPSCGDPDGLIYEEGCLKCKSCGYSAC